MSLRQWESAGGQFLLPLGGCTWSLRLDTADHGLRPEPESSPTILALLGLTASGWREWHPLGNDELSLVEHHRTRVEATYRPRDSGGLVVRAAWSPVDELEGVDLEVQISASSVGELGSVELILGSGEFTGPPLRPKFHPRHQIDPKDRHLMNPWLDESPRIGPPADEGWEFGPLILEPVPGVSGSRYLEMVHPQDLARRVVDPGPEGETASICSVKGVRYGLFGHDLEKGVVVRGRVRGLWIPDGDSGSRAAEAEEWRRFRMRPLPLGS